MPLTPAAAQAKVVAAKARAARADRRLYLVPRIGLVFEGKHAGLTKEGLPAFRLGTLWVQVVLLPRPFRRRDPEADPLPP